MRFGRKAVYLQLLHFAKTLKTSDGYFYARNRVLLTFGCKYKIKVFINNNFVLIFKIF